MIEKNPKIAVNRGVLTLFWIKIRISMSRPEIKSINSVILR